MQTIHRYIERTLSYWGHSPFVPGLSLGERAELYPKHKHHPRIQQTFVLPSVYKFACYTTFVAESPRDSEGLFHPASQQPGEKKVVISPAGEETGSERVRPTICEAEVQAQTCQRPQCMRFPLAHLPSPPREETPQQCESCCFQGPGVPPSVCLSGQLSLIIL